MLEKTKYQHNPLNNTSGFIVAEFLFAFVMVIGISIFIFAMTFSLATIEISQYIVFSAARSYSAGNKSKDESEKAGQTKFDNLAVKFPLLTGKGASIEPWFQLTDFLRGDLSNELTDFNSDDIKNKNRQPWTGASAKLKLSLFSGLRVPFLGKVADPSNTTAFEFPIRAFLIRHVSQEECRKFFLNQRFDEGTLRLEKGKLATEDPTKSTAVPKGLDQYNGFGEDNGC